MMDLHRQVDCWSKRFKIEPYAIFKDKISTLLHFINPMAFAFAESEPLISLPGVAQDQWPWSAKMVLVFNHVL